MRTGKKLAGVLVAVAVASGGVYLALSPGGMGKERVDDSRPAVSAAVPAGWVRVQPHVARAPPVAAEQRVRQVMDDDRRGVHQVRRKAAHQNGEGRGGGPDGPYQGLPG